MCACVCLCSHPFGRTDGVKEREGKRKEGSGGSMTVQSAETDGCGVITCRRGNKRACTLVKAGERGEKVKERGWAGKKLKFVRRLIDVRAFVWVCLRGLDFQGL